MDERTGNQRLMCLMWQCSGRPQNVYRTVRPLCLFVAYNEFIDQQNIYQTLVEGREQLSKFSNFLPHQYYQYFKTTLGVIGDPSEFRNSWNVGARSIWCWKNFDD